MEGVEKRGGRKPSRRTPLPKTVFAPPSPDQSKGDTTKGDFAFVDALTGLGASRIRLNAGLGCFWQLFPTGPPLLGTPPPAIIPASKVGTAPINPLFCVNLLELRMNPNNL